MKEFTREKVLAHMTRGAGIRYQCNNLARVFRVGPEIMRPVLLDLLEAKQIDSGSTGKYRFYYVPTATEKAAQERVHIAFMTKPLAGYEAKMRGIAAAAERGR